MRVRVRVSLTLTLTVAQCFRALYLIVPAYAYAKGAARCLVGTMGVAFVGGWLLFPLMLALGHLGAPLTLALSPNPHPHPHPHPSTSPSPNPSPNSHP